MNNPVLSMAIWNLSAGYVLPCISNMTELLLILHMKLEISWTIVSLDDGSDVAVPTIGQPDLQN